MCKYRPTVDLLLSEMKQNIFNVKNSQLLKRIGCCNTGYPFPCIDNALEISFVFSGVVLKA
jgi:hypothetical protein